MAVTKKQFKALLKRVSECYRLPGKVYLKVNRLNV